MLIWVQAILCSCSENEDVDKLSFSLIDHCKDRPEQALSKSEVGTQEYVPKDTVYFEKRNDGQVFVHIDIPVSCGSASFSIYSEVKEDTLFIDAKTDGDASTSCSCVSEVEVDIPNDMISVKYLVLQRKRFFARNVIFKD